MPVRSIFLSTSNRRVVKKHTRCEVSLGLLYDYKDLTEVLRSYFI